MGLELTTLVVIGTDCIDSCKSNYHMITTMTPPPYLGQAIPPPISLEVRDIAEYKNVLGEKKYQGGNQQ